MTVLTVSKPTHWLEREMASSEQVNRVFTRPGSTFVEDPHPSEILANRSKPGQRMGQLYRSMRLSDEDLGGICLKRGDEVLALDRLLRPGDDSPKAREAMDLAQWNLAQIKGWSDRLRHLHSGVYDGIAILELVWERLSRGPWSRAWAIVDVIARPMHRFAFRRGQLYVRRALGDPIPAPPNKFVVFRRGGLDRGWPDALMDNTYWSWFLKNHGWKMWAIYLQRFGNPIPVVTFDTGGTRASRGEAIEGTGIDANSQAEIEKALRAFQTEQGFALPKEVKIDLLESSRSGASFETFSSACSRRQALLFLGEVNTSGLNRSMGSFASDKVAHKVSRTKTKIDSHDLGTTIKDQLLRWLTLTNFGDLVPGPAYEFSVADLDDGEQQRRGADNVLESGEPVPRRHYYRVNRVPEPRPGEEVIVRHQAADPPIQQPPAAELTARSPVQLAAADPTSRAEAEQRLQALDQIATEFSGSTIDYYQQLREQLLVAWDAGQVSQGTALTAALSALDPAAHARQLQTAMVHSTGLGFAHLQADGLPPHLWSWPGQPGPHDDELLDLPLTAPRPATLAVADGFSNARTPGTAADFWADQLSISRSLFDLLSDTQRRHAFTVAGVNDTRLLLRIHQLMATAVTSDLSRDDFVAQLDQLYIAQGVHPTARWHAELVYSNNVRQAHGALRWQQTVGNPAAHRLLPYIEYFTFGDDRTRARPDHDHTVLDGLVFAISHPIWNTWWFPAGHGCRCLIGTINRLAAKRRGLLGAEPTGPWPGDPHGAGRALPDPGFRGVASLEPLQEKLLSQLSGQVFQARRRQNEGEPGAFGLLQALRLLLNLLLGPKLVRALFGGSE